MPDISAKDVAALRKVSGAGMMDCKRALEESEGDLDKAKTWLREKGLAAAGKRAGRAAQQGAVDVFVDGGVGALAELTCETDFVAKGDGFKSAVAALARQAAEQGEDIAGKPFAGDPSQTVAAESAMAAAPDPGVVAAPPADTADAPAGAAEAPDA